MGTHQYGRDYRIKVGDGAGPEVFSIVGGEGTWSKKNSSDKVDFSSKDDGAYKAMGWGQQEVTISVQGKVKLPDTGLQRVASIATSSPPELSVEIVKGSLTIFKGTMGVGNFSMDAASGGPVNYSFDLTAVSAPTTDDLSVIT